MWLIATPAMRLEPLALRTVASALTFVVPVLIEAVAFAVVAASWPEVMVHVPRLLVHVKTPHFAGNCTGRLLSAEPVAADNEKLSHVNTVGAPEPPD